MEKGYVERRLAQGGQVVTILKNGITILNKEFSEYSLIFGTQKEIEMKGNLETGLGEGGYYISKKGYMRQFQSKLKWKPYEGTFNLRLNDDEIPKIEAMKAAEGILIEGFIVLSAVFAFFSGVQLLSIGFLGEYLGRVHSQTQERPDYIVEKVIE